MDNGKIRFTTLHDAPYAQIYAHDEITADDVQWAIETIRSNFAPPVTLVVQNVGEYWISVEAQKRLVYDLKEITEMIIIADKKSKMAEALLAEKSYLMSVTITLCHSVEEADALLEKHLHRS